MVAGAVGTTISSPLNVGHQGPDDDTGRVAPARGCRPGHLQQRPPPREHSKFLLTLLNECLKCSTTSQSILLG
jgi:hypothetical protein